MQHFIQVSSKKEIINDLLVSCLSVSDQFTKPDYVASNDSKKSAKREASSVQSSPKRRETSENKCGYCHKEYVEDEEWIDCDECRKWYHRVCVNVSDKFWNMVTQESAATNFEYVCTFCKQ